jgi:hypothetical protein
VPQDPLSFNLSLIHGCLGSYREEARLWPDIGEIRRGAGKGVKSKRVEIMFHEADDRSGSVHASKAFALRLRVDVGL